MSINYSIAMQRPRAAYIEADFGDLPSGVFTPIGIQLPPGSIVVNGRILVLTASDAVTSETLTLGTAGSAASLGSVANSKTAGGTAANPDSAPSTGVRNIGLTRTAVGAQTVGQYGVWIEYLLAGASDGTQG